MVAPSMRSAARDSVLIALSVAVTVLAWWPRSAPRQLVQVRREAGNRVAYAIPLDDPRLGEIRQHLFNVAHPGPPTEWVLARWRHRLATHYIAHPPAPQRGGAASSGAEPVTDVSGSSQRGIAASRDYWVREKARAERTIQAEQRRRARQRAAADTPPVELGATIAGRRRPGGWLAAVASGVLAALVFAQWRQRWPAVGAIRGRTANRRAAADRAEESAAPTLSVGAAEAVRVEIPAQWVRFRQPWPVALRRWAMAAVVTAALGSIWGGG